MRFTPKNRVGRTAAAGAIALAMLGSAGCSAVNEQATTREYSPSDGIVQDVGDLQLRNILVVSHGFGEPGRLIGTVVNDSDNTQAFTLAVGGSTLSWSLPAGDKVIFEDESEDKVNVSTVEDEPGTGIDAQLKVSGETTALNIPVVNGDQADYRPYLPAGSTAPPSETATAEETGGASEGH
ncbi:MULTISPECIES: hypothetical protein [unclassified Arthrobacter]|uniref:hypothetical protein n=1 Tax=unclassified Arthrobacter TaxID=235627 RepID=UPI001E36B7EA|nr:MULTISPECIES: hypothetical protein [unclassified Arthrobacter]MCC9146643.1 hypothetical protein [Arthrobacter sp. zg-Y919]MDK1277873.1 hypothetical protein [Arthrobacter sp. zg.Y919]WIB03531.1 hypothetical protein QNO10_02235 [Arthrobacter sp. zg-Y919]